MSLNAIITTAELLERTPVKESIRWTWQVAYP